MSTTPTADHEPTIDGCRPADVTPVALDAAALDSTATTYLREFKQRLIEQGLSPASLTIEACFDERCSLATQDEIDRVRNYVRAGAFLGVGTVTVVVDEVTDAETVTPALSATAERAERDGVTLELAGDASLAC